MSDQSSTLASNFKRIRFFECDQIEDQKAKAVGKKGEMPVADPNSKERTIQDVNVIHMIYLDMFFLFLGTPPAKAGEFPIEYFYLTKNL